MIDTGHVLISLEARHAENILSGLKQVELRRRSMNVTAGTTIWMYVKLPLGRVVGSVRVKDFCSLAPSTLWKRFADVSGLTRNEFFTYFGGVSRGFALELEAPQRMPVGVSLTELRSIVTGFQPPQFFLRLPPDGAVLKAISDQSTPLKNFDELDLTNSRRKMRKWPGSSKNQGNQQSHGLDISVLRGGGLTD
jgi:predicted transcriptional regulator